MALGDASRWAEMWPPPKLGDFEVHIWKVPLAGSAQELEAARSILAPSEIVRADKFIFDKHRQRFALGRAALRRIVGQYSGTSPADVNFDYDGLGKPRLRGTALGQGLCFNFSNSHELGLLALTLDAEIGIDVEFHRELLDMVGLAERFFCEDEIRQLQSLSGQDQQSTFFRLWTRKEAFLKAVGKGLTFPLNQVEVSCLEHDPAEIRVIDGQPADEWHLNHLVPHAGYSGAVAMRRKFGRVLCFSSIS